MHFQSLYILNTSRSQYCIAAIMCISIVDFDPANKDVPLEISLPQVVPLGADEDPCRAVTCDSNSYCLASDGVASCVCSPGFEEYVVGDKSRGCVDVDECSRGEDDCDVNAECVNQSGSYRCVCLAGYVGNGVSCESKRVLIFFVGNLVFPKALSESW